MVKYILGSCTCSVPVLVGVNPSKSIRFKFCLKVERSYTYRFILFVTFYVIHYGVRAAQCWYKFPARIAQLYERDPLPCTKAYEYATFYILRDARSNRLSQNPTAAITNSAPSCIFAESPLMISPVMGCR